MTQYMNENKNTDPFERVIGYESIKKELRMISDALRHPEAYQRLGARMPRGLMIYGMPGLGKTLMAECFIEASGLKSFLCQRKDPSGMFVDTINRVYEEAAEAAPGIVFLDDLDKFSNTDSEYTDTEEFVTVQSCIDKAKKAGVFTIATVNDIGRLPSSLIRSGRFDRTIHVQPPSGRDAEEIVAYYLKGKAFETSADPRLIARILVGRSCADLETVINEAGIWAGYKRKDRIEMEDFIEACIKTVFHMDTLKRNVEDVGYYPGVREEEPVMAEPSMEEKAYHEAGHILTGEILSPGNVTLSLLNDPRGNAGGMTLFYDEFEDSLERLEKSVICGLGGKAAVEYQFGKYDSGANMDMVQTKRKVKIILGSGYGWDMGFSLSDMPSEAQRLRQETMIYAEMERLKMKARQIIATHKEELDRLAQALLGKGMLLGDEIRKIIRG